MSTPVITQRYWDEVKEGEEISGFEMFCPRPRWSSR